jgi:hypothetical protein
MNVNVKERKKEKSEIGEITKIPFPDIQSPPSVTLFTSSTKGKE